MAKTLGKKAEKVHKGHMCSMMAMQMEGGLGYDDLNDLMKDPQPLEFIIELLTVENPDEYKKESWQMDADEKLTSVPKLKEEGNKLYSTKQFKEAADKYADALGRLEQLMLRWELLGHCRYLEIINILFNPQGKASRWRVAGSAWSKTASLT